MNKKYYLISEVVKNFEKENLHITLEEICSYVRELLITPIIYIDSIWVHACELKENGEGMAVGACALSAYWNVENDIIGVLDAILRQESVKVGYVVKRENLITERLMGWSTQRSIFKGVPSNSVNPKPYSEELNIYGFIFFSNNPFYVSLKNIVLKQEDVNFLSSILKKKPIKPHSVTPKERKHELREVIKTAYKNEKLKIGREPTNTEVWSVVNNLEYDTDEIINDVTNSYIEWSDWKGKPRKMQRTTFNNYITELKSDNLA